MPLQLTALLHAVDSGKLDAIRVVPVKAPGKAINVTEEFLSSLQPQKEFAFNAATGDGAHHKVAAENSTNQLSEPPLHARPQKDACVVVVPRALARKIEGNPTRIDVVDRLEKAVRWPQ